MNQPQMYEWCLIPDGPVERYVCQTRAAGSPPALPWPAVVNYTDGTRASTPWPVGPLMELRVELLQHPAPRNYPILVLPRDDADPSHGDSVELTNRAGFLFVPESSWLQPLLPLPGFPDPWVSLLGFCLSSPARTDGTGTWAPIPALCTVPLLISSKIQTWDGAS